MQEFAQALTIGLTNGLIIAMVAIGYTLVYGILEFINFANGDIFMLGSAFTFLITNVIVNGLGIPASAPLAFVLTLVALPFIMLATAGINAGIERVAYRPLRHAPKVASMISAIGMSFVIQNVALVLLGPTQKAVQPVLPRTAILTLSNGATWIGFPEVMVVLVTIPMLVGLRWFVNKTRQGKGIRATAQDREAAGLMGIDVNKTIAVTFFISGGLAGAAGLVVAIYYGQTWFQLGFQFGLMAFTAAVLGGIGNLTGATFGGIVIGVLTAMSDRYLETRWTPVIVFSLLVLILIVRPTGIMGERQTDRA